MLDYLKQLPDELNFVFEDNLKQVLNKPHKPKFNETYDIYSLIKIYAEQMANGEKLNERHILTPNDVDKEAITEALESLLTENKIILWAVYTLERSTFKVITIGDVYKIYDKLCEINEVDPIIPYRMNILLNVLSMLGLIQTKVVSVGRYGRATKINLSISQSDVRVILGYDKHIKKISDFNTDGLFKNNWRMKKNNK